MDDDEIRRRIRDKMASGDLPRQHPLRTWAGFGTGQPCGVCNDIIGSDTVELEAEGADRKLRFYHSRCYTLLVQERTGGDVARQTRCDADW
jgi:hypothetical protein